MVAEDDDAVLDLSKSDNVVIPIRSNDRDPEGQTFTVAALSTPTHGTVEVLGNGALRYTSTSAASVDSFTYTIRSSDGRQATATVTVVIVG